MPGNILRVALSSCLLLTGLAGTAAAVELRKTPYLPSLQPSKPAIPNGDIGSTGPKSGSSKCYGSVGCDDSGNYISGEGVLRYKNGAPLQIRPSTRPPVTTRGPSSNHIRWCSNQYRSYRTSDDTYQPLAGPRTGCNSPFQ
ncbi:BA14K family protein [Falsochrobactrum sp. TDYN1]|uniref:Lectin-like protein BA14k n=1 Tax=Falsochrobactrum tianjinense TaxID=2706015 RepID=A0A949PNG4_9HYPH|nr:BA14K family protein [Falsochrobactrum sp. TDYN1]MBV2143882.1 BA14K family protein [Falsochrobactrum sp. TDYN1]